MRALLVQLNLSHNRGSKFFCLASVIARTFWGVLFRDLFIYLYYIPMTYLEQNSFEKYKH